MATEKSNPRVQHGVSKLEKKAAQGVGPGFEKDPQNGTQNPFTSQLKPAASSSEAQSSEE